MVQKDNSIKIAEEKNGNWRFHTQLERGNAQNRFVGLDFLPAQQDNIK